MYNANGQRSHPRNKLRGFPALVAIILVVFITYLLISAYVHDVPLSSDDKARYTAPDLGFYVI